jgi:mitotic spindle assembly checkpoint protein MAD2B
MDLIGQVKSIGHGRNSREDVDPQELGDAFAEFLEVALHHILYIRGVYPREGFNRRKKYDLPVQMCRLPLVNAYICEILQTVKAPILQNVIERITISILDSDEKQLESWIFDLDLHLETQQLNYSWEDLEKEWQAFLLKVNLVEALQPAVPEGVTWRLLVETREIISGGEKWVRGEETQEPGKIVPLKSLALGKTKFQLYFQHN